MRVLLLVAAGLYLAHRLENKARLKKEKQLQEERTQAVESSLDEALEDSFPASDPPSYSPTQYHH